MKPDRVVKMPSQIEMALSEMYEVGDLVCSGCGHKIVTTTLDKVGNRTPKGWVWYYSYGFYFPGETWIRAPNYETYKLLEIRIKLHLQNCPGVRPGEQLKLFKT